jgi:putative transcriptional regulator
VKNDVRERRGERGLSQGQLAAAMGVSRQAINALETGRYVPSLPRAMNLAAFFDQAVEQLFHLDNTEIR